MPQHHQAYQNALSNTAHFYLTQAAQIGEHTRTYILKLLLSKKFEQQTYDSCKGLLQLGRIYGIKRLENACKLVKDHDIFSYKTAKNILNNNLDLVDREGHNQSPTADTTSTPSVHDNQRGEQYYQ